MANSARNCGICRATCSGSKSFMARKLNSTEVSQWSLTSVFSTASFRLGEYSDKTLSKLFLSMFILFLADSGRCSLPLL
ncbi:hypothetical protein D3C76_1778190 [compost metagenome]